MQRLRLTRPDDWHVHLRDGDALPQAVADISRYFARAIVMPNLTPPVRDLAAAQAYKQRILAALGTGTAFTPLMTLYLTDNTSADDIRVAAANDIVYAAKLYPAGATTNSDAGVTDVKHIYPALEAMQDTGLPLLVHGEVTSPEIDIFDREATFIERVLKPLLNDFPALRIVFEHITTKDAVDFVAAGPDTLAATLTAHHLLFNRNDMLVGGVRPHLYCLPILKRNTHQQALIAAGTSGSGKFFIGSDSAPHPQHLKENACGCAGCYTAHAALELYAQAFEAAGALDKLEGFASFFGPDFYGLPRNTDHITLVKEAWQAPASLDFGQHQLLPLGAGETLAWRVE